MLFLALVYIAEGLGQVGGLISQPLNYFLVKGLGWEADRVTEFLAILTIPWVIKPLYGLVSDFIPLFGYRRKTYLFLANGLAVGAYIWLAGMTAPSQILLALMLTAIGMAISSTLCGAVMVENGKRTGLSGSFVNQQWLWFYIASIGTSYLGGWLISHTSSPAAALHIAAILVAIAPIGVMIGCWSLIKEDKAKVDLAGFKASTASLWKALRSKTLWIVGFFLFFYNFSPGFGTPLFVHMTNVLNFDQDFIGTLGAIAGVGAIIGSFLFMWLQKRMTMKSMLNLSILLGIIGQASFLLMSMPALKLGSLSFDLAGHAAPIAIVLNLVNGIFGMIALVASLTLAADYCPDGSEGFSYALLMSLNNLAMQLSANIGAYMYVHWFNHVLTPLILVSAAVTGLCFVLVPVLRLGNRRPGEKAPNHDDGANGGAKNDSSNDKGNGKGNT
jgi:MFS family permease